MAANSQYQAESTLASERTVLGWITTFGLICMEGFSINGPEGRTHGRRNEHELSTQQQTQLHETQRNLLLRLRAMDRTGDFEQRVQG